MKTFTRGGSYLYQLHHSLVRVQLLTLDRGHECLRGIWNRGVQMNKCIHCSKREKDGCLSVHHAWLWHRTTCWWYPAGLPPGCKMSQSFDIIKLQNVFDRSVGAAEGWSERCCVFVFVPQPPDPSLILQGVHPKGDVCYLAPHPHSHCLPLAWSCVIMEHSLLIRANLCCWETLGPIQHRPIPFKHHPSLFGSP